MGSTERDRRGLVLAIVAALLAVAIAGAPAARAQASETPHVEVYGFVQADYIQDFKQVNDDWQDTLRPSRIPTADGEFGEDGQASVSAKQSRLGVQMNLPTSNQPVYTKFEFDMFGVGEDEGKTTIRLRHAYGEWGEWLGGQTNTLFMDASIFPTVIDYWGPCGMVFLRTPQIRWTPMAGDTSFAIALEKPSNDIDPGVLREVDPSLGDDVHGSQKVPDFTAQFRKKQEWGHFQLAGILRQVSFDTHGTPNNEPKDDKFGWGIDATSGIKVGEKDKILVGVVYGEGIATYMNDGGTDLAGDGTLGDAEAETLELTGISAYFDHFWSEKFSSSIGYSSTSVDNTSLQTGDAFETGQYASANLLWYPTQNVFVGAEGLWGEREDKDGSVGVDSRVQISFHFSFSSKDVFKKN